MLLRSIFNSKGREADNLFWNRGIIFTLGHKDDHDALGVFEDPE